MKDTRSEDAAAKKEEMRTEDAAIKKNDAQLKTQRRKRSWERLGKKRKIGSLELEICVGFATRDLGFFGSLR